MDMALPQGIHEAIQLAAERVLAESPEAPVRTRLLREILEVPSNNGDLRAAAKELDEHPHVQVLAKEQQSDGSWGRFHTADSAAKRKIGTTQMGVQRAVELGLAADHPILTRARRYLEGILCGDIPFPDRPEKHENWTTGIAMFTGATLARFAHEAPSFNDTWEFWAAVTRGAFRSGVYDLDAELEVHRRLLNRSGKPQWMRLNSMPVLMILGARPGRLPDDVQAAYVDWLWNHCPKGLVYADVPLDSEPATMRGHRIGSWLTSLELLSAFASSQVTAGPALERLLALRNEERLWDLGVQSSCPRFSASYRKRRCCAHDWTMRVACLLKRYFRQP